MMTFSSDAKQRLLFALTYGPMSLLDLAAATGLQVASVQTGISSLLKDSAISEEQLGRKRLFSLRDEIRPIVMPVKEGFQKASRISSQRTYEQRLVEVCTLLDRSYR